MRKLPEVKLQKGKVESLLNQLSQHFEQESSKDCRRNQIKLAPSEGGGQLITYSDQSGVDVLLIDLPGAVEWSVQLQGDFSEPLTFYTVCSGTLRVSSGDEAFQVSPLQSAIHGGFSHNEHHLQMSGMNGVRLMLVFVHREVFFKEMDCDELDLPEELVSVVLNGNIKAPQFLFSDIFHLPIINAVNEIVNQQDFGLLNSSFAAAKVHEILFLQLNEYKTYEGKKRHRIIRENGRIELIRDAEKILISRLKNPPTIPELARMVGLNQQTLKQGFRQLYGKSINQQLNGKRLEQAGILIRAGELSLAEVSLEVGYNNPGYFSRRFREEYGVTPRYFSQAEGKENKD